MDIFSIQAVGAACMMMGGLLGFTIGRVNALAEFRGTQQSCNVAIEE